MSRTVSSSLTSFKKHQLMCYGMRIPLDILTMWDLSDAKYLRNVSPGITLKRLASGVNHDISFF